MGFVIPHVLKVEHEQLHNTVRNGIEEGGEVGVAATAVAELMHPHFLKEEEYALPPLGLLSDLSRGVVTPGAKDVLVLTDKLKADLPQMLAEHRSIVAALEKLSSAAKDAGKSEYVEFAEALTLHARTEEEIMYPAALLIGEYVRTRADSA
jgi:hypothetical protein